MFIFSFKDRSFFFDTTIAMQKGLLFGSNFVPLSFLFVVVQAQVLGSAGDSSEFLLKPFDFFGRGERENHDLSFLKFHSL